MQTREHRRPAWVLPVVGVVALGVVVAAVWLGVSQSRGSDLDTAQALMADWAAASNTNDAEAVASLFAPDGELVTSDGSFRGPAEIAHYVETLDEAFDFEVFDGESTEAGSHVFTVSWRTPLDLDGTSHHMTWVAEADLTLDGDRIGRLEIRDG